MINLLQIIGVFMGTGYLVLKTDEKEKIRKTTREIIRDNHPKLRSLELERHTKLFEIDKFYKVDLNDPFYDSECDDYGYAKHNEKEQINSIYNKLVLKAIDEIENSKFELETLKKILEEKEETKFNSEKIQENLRMDFQINAIKYAQDVYRIFDGYSKISKVSFKESLMLQFPLPIERFNSLYFEITNNMSGIVEEDYHNKNEFVIKFELQRKPNEKSKQFNSLIVYYDEWKIKNNKINNEVKEKLNNEKILLNNIENYGVTIQEIFEITTKQNPSLSKDYVKKRLEVILNLTNIESNDLCNSLLNSGTGLIEENYDLLGFVKISSFLNNKTK